MQNAHTKIAVVGATGRVGRHVAGLLAADGHDVVPIARSRGVDVITGEGLAEALEGVDSVVDAATGPSPEEGAATEFFTAATRNLQAAGQAAGVRQIVVVSIIGADRFGGGYGVAKVAHERDMLAGPVPAQVLRAAQFHEFVPQLMEWGRQGDVVYVPRMRTQLVSARTVARALANLAVGTPPAAGAPIAEIAGPREESLVEMATLYAAQGGDAVRVEGVSNPADPNTAPYEGGGLLPGPHATLAGPTFAEWLAGRLEAAA